MTRPGCTYRTYHCICNALADFEIGMKSYHTTVNDRVCIDHLGHSVDRMLKARHDMHSLIIKRLKDD